MCNFWKSYVIYLICLATLNAKLITSGQLGGLHEVDPSECYEAFEKSKMLLKYVGHNTDEMKIKTCHVQVVAGLIYHFALAKIDNSECEMKIMRTLKNTMEPLMEQSTCLNDKQQEDMKETLIK